VRRIAEHARGRRVHRVDDAVAIDGDDGGDGVSEADLLVHDERAHDPGLAFALARMRHPGLPEPFGVLRAVERPAFEVATAEQMELARAGAHGAGLDKLFASGDTWEVAGS